MVGLRIQIDFSRDQVRAAVVSAWAQVDAAEGAIVAAQEGVEAAEIALSGVQEEQKVGQRTTLDVLDAQQVLLDARETLVIAQREPRGRFLLGAVGDGPADRRGAGLADRGLRPDPALPGGAGASSSASRRRTGAEPRSAILLRFPRRAFLKRRERV